MGGLKASAQPWGFITHHIERALYWLILIGIWLPCPFQRSAQLRVTVSTSSAFCMGRLFHTIPTTIVPTLFFGGESHYSFLCLGTVSSAFVSLCLCFSLILILPGCFYPSWDFMICLFVCFVLCGVGFFECVCVIFDLFYYFCHSIFWSFIFIFPPPFCVPSFFSPSFFLFYVPCSLSIYLSYIFAVKKRPPKVALPWYSLPG